MQKTKRIVLMLLMFVATLLFGACRDPQTALSAPQISLNGNVVSWNAVENAATYDVYVDDELKESTVLTSYTLILEPGSYGIRVKALPSDTKAYTASAFSNEVTYVAVSPSAEVLSAPVLTLEGDVVRWSAIEHAVSYDVFVDGSLAANVTETSYSLTIAENGSYRITVTAKGDGVNYTSSAASEALTYTVGESAPEKLSAPVLTLEENVVRWSAVDNAVNYDVYVDGAFVENVTQTNYALDIAAEGSYRITVVAKGDGSRYISSDPSVEVTYVYGKYFVRIEKISDPATTTYYIDEKKTLDLTGMSVHAVYSNGDTESVTLTEENIVSEYDLTQAGRYELEFVYTGANNVKSAIVVRINVKERSVADVGEYQTFVNEYGSESYLIADFAATGAATMTGTPIAVSVEGGKTYAAGSALAEGETFLRVSDGTKDSFVNVIVARYIETVADFNGINENLNGYYILRNDLDFSDVKCTPIGRAPLVTVTEGESTKHAVDLTGAGSSDGALGVTFTGTFNGNGYVLKNFSYTGGNGESWWKADCYALGLFGHVGETGCVKNLTLRNVTIRGGDNCAFIAGLNQGTIENICVEDNCVLFNAYGQGAVISACNYGTVKNVVSYVTGTAWNYGADVSVNVVKKEAEYTSDSGVNGYIGETADLTETLGEGWFYIDGYGTVYGNDSYSKVIAADTIWYVGDEIKISFWQKRAADVYFAVWGTSASDPTTVLTFLSYDGATSTYTLKIADGLTIAANTKLTVGIGASGVGYVELFDVTIGEPYATGYAAPAAEIVAEQGSELDLTAIGITVSYSDGTTAEINPVAVADYDKLGEIGQTQTVKLFYGTGENDYVTASVTLVRGASSGYELKVSATGSKLTYSATSSVDLSGCTFTLVTPDGERTLALSELTVSGVQSGLTEVTFTYTSGDVTARATHTFEIWYTITQASEWAMMNGNLSGYYVLGNDIDLQGATYSAVIGQAPIIPASEGYQIDPTGAGSNEGIVGVAFTGKFDGAGYTVKGFASAYEGAAYLPSAYALTPFAYVGEGGVVRNFTLAGASIRCGQNGSFLVGLNLGTVEDITIAADCTMYVHYSTVSPYAVVVNGGTVKNITCNVKTFENRNGTGNSIAGAAYQTVGDGKETDCTLAA